MNGLLLFCHITLPGKRGGPTRGAEAMLRMYLLQNWFNLSDEGVEDAIYDSYAFRKFMGIDFQKEEQLPNATTLCKFRKLLNNNGITKLFFDTMKAHLGRPGKLMHGKLLWTQPSSMRQVQRKTGEPARPGDAPGEKGEPVVFRGAIPYRSGCRDRLYPFRGGDRRQRK